MKLFINGIEATEQDWEVLKKWFLEGKVRVFSRPLVGNELHVVTIG